MKIAIMGAGGIGGCYGALLAKSGADVTLIARGAHLAAIQQNGLKLIQQDSDFTAQVNATDDPSQVGPVDLVIFAVKTYQNGEAIPFINPLVGNDSTILTIQNGVESAAELSREYGAEWVLPGSAYVISNIDAPGVVRQRSFPARVAFGEADGNPSQRATTVEETMSGAGISVELSDDIVRALWSKALYNSAANGMASAARLAPKDLMGSPQGPEIFRSAIQEIADVASASGVQMGEEDVQRAFDLIGNRPMGAKGSMQVDVEAGRPLELEAMVGFVGRIGREVNVPTPIFDVLYTVLLPHINGHLENH
ncbi:MAG: 2-dehydropantoate 2-reductase [Dehalococcoidia bacterium]|nr:2-dehydropantoate 2-reductase [Dehalococcoidia bacterium]